MALTADQLADLQADLGLSADQSVFTNAELERLFTRALEDEVLTRVYGLRSLLISAARLNDYTAGASSEKKSQVFDHLKSLYEMWSGEAGMALGTLTAGVIDLDFMEKGE